MPQNLEKGFDWLGNHGQYFVWCYLLGEIFLSAIGPTSSLLPLHPSSTVAEFLNSEMKTFFPDLIFWFGFNQSKYIIKTNLYSPSLFVDAALSQLFCGINCDFCWCFAKLVVHVILKTTFLRTPLDTKLKQTINCYK